MSDGRSSWSRVPPGCRDLRPPRTPYPRAIGRRTGVANILGINFSGFIAWWLWRTIYLSKLPRFEKKLRVALDWTLDLIFSKDLVQFLDIRAPMVSRPEAYLSQKSKTVQPELPEPVP